jgi:gas vesicle protein
MSDRDDLSSFLLGFIIGGLTGAVVSLLLAPQSGEETRAVIRDKAIELKDRASETMDEAYARAEEAAAEARARAEEFSQIAKARADELQRRGQVVLEEQRAKVETAINQVRKTTASKNNAEANPAPEE